MSRKEEQYVEELADIIYTYFSNSHNLLWNIETFNLHVFDIKPQMLSYC